MDSTSLQDIDSGSKKTDKGPSPTDLEAFLQWASCQLQFTFNIVLSKITLNDSTRGNTARAKVRDDINLTDSQTSNSMNFVQVAHNKHNSIFIDAVYDNNDYLVQLKFKKNSNIPVELLKLLSLIVQFHPRLSAIYINRGLNQNGLNQLSKAIASNFNITEVILDDTVLEQANYYMLLEDNCHLKYLSLARCKLNDTAIEVLSSKLDYPSKASKTLLVLNLSTNRITDEGAKYIADVLRRNRQLSFVNLSGNMITDIGAESIFSCLKIFPLTTDEINQKKARNFEYMKEKKKFIKETVEKMRIDFEKRYSARKKSNKPEITPTKKAKSAEISIDTNTLSIPGLDAIWLEKAQTAAEEMVGKFEDPYNEENTTCRGEMLYCYGNNTLRYLNLAYNDLTYFSIKKLHEVLSFQSAWNRKPKGLIKVCIEGNNLPVACQELSEIDVLLEMGLTRVNSAIVRKKTGAKTSQK